ncbi:MAG: hypothetical protein IT432_11940 [Phycisphaerales bacterium]|nr:hypothetical protein [Phycisphaerales bacterium]
MLGFRALVGGIAGGVIGVILWTSVTYFTGYEIGWVACLVGVLTGLGVSAAIEKRGGVLTGLLACLIAVGAIGVGKITMARLAASEAIADVGDNFTDEDAVFFMARNDAEARPNDERGFDPAAIDRAAARWRTMSETEHDAYRLQAANEVRQEMEANAEAVTVVALVRSLSPYDLLWIGLAALSALKLASRNDKPCHSTFIQNVANKEGGLHPVFKGSSEADSMNPASFGGIRGLPSSPSGATPRFAPGAQAAAPPGADQDHAPRAHASDNEAA